MTSSSRTGLPGPATSACRETGHTDTHTTTVLHVPPSAWSWPTAREFYDQMTGLYPDRLNPGVVWYGALGLLGG